jgi:hypothetical protein
MVFMMQIEGDSGIRPAFYELMCQVIFIVAIRLTISFTLLV